MVEHFLDMEVVGGSIPLAPTSLNQGQPVVSARADPRGRLEFDLLTPAQLDSVMERLSDS